MRFPLRRVLLGFAAGAAAGWAAGLLRRPPAALVFDDAAEVTRIEQEPAAEPEAVAPAEEPAAEEAAEPALAGAEEIAQEPTAPVAEPEPEPEPAPEQAAAKPKRRRATAATPDPVAGAAEALREGHAAATEHLDVDVTPAPPKRRRPPAKG
ncbi:MAG TPA: hypothetical protein VFQ85_09950 [Mycobacteriales bacterium]|jgi:hypothetical protein|nr:hypothetical protein [Mycobacteriales bacterium]